MTHLLNTVEVEIGGQKIDKHYGEWLNIYNELFEKNHHYRNALTQQTTTPNSVTTDTPTEIYIPLRFWFNRNAGLALPLIALQYHEVKILMNLKPTATTSISDASLLVNYVYLDTDERRRFAQVSHEYLIEQVQHTGVESIGANGGSIDLTFNHPVKGLFWRGFAENTTYQAKLQLNGYDRFTKQSDRYFHLVQPYENGLGHTRGLKDNKWTTDIGGSNSWYVFILFKTC